MTKWTVRFIVMCAVLAASASLYAHHSLAGMYALGKEAKVAGAFKAFRLVNPHSSLRFDAKDKDGKVLMKPAEDLSDDDIKALVALMRTFKK